MKLALAATIALLTLKSARAQSIPLENQVVHYIASVGIGSPPTEYKLIVDTGSSNTWIGANTAYVPTSSSQQTPDSFSVSSSSDHASGTEYIDTVSLGDGLVVQGQSIGVASSSDGFKSGVDGVLGLGPVDLTLGTLSPDTSATVPTVLDNLFNQGTIPAHSYGVSFEPTTSSSEVNGEITFGGVDSSKFTGSITYVPITGTSPASNYWGIDATFTYGSSGKTILSPTAGIVDSGTTRLLLASDAFKEFQSATGATIDATTNLLTLTSSQYANMESLFVHIGATTFELTPNALIWPRSLNSEIGGSPGSIYLIVGDHGQPSGQGLDFILGYKVMERLYTVFDAGNQRVGFATTPFTDATTN
ncbi:MAG: family A1 protease [Linnemannia elongata]|nr:MAG: family A1 protease [Linnemannia elongata]